MNAPWFKGLSIRAKLLSIILVTSGVALVMAGIAIITSELIAFRQQRIADLTTQAAILGSISSAALIFNDPKAAEEYLSALKERPEIVTAIIYDSKGQVFAIYRGKGSSRLNPLPKVEAEGHRRDADDIVLFPRIVHPNVTI